MRQSTGRPIVFLVVIFLKIELTSAALNSSGKQPFLKEKLLIFVGKEVWISIVDFVIPAIPSLGGFFAI